MTAAAVLAHGGAPGALVELAGVLLLGLVGLLVWWGSRCHPDGEQTEREQP